MTNKTTLAAATPIRERNRDLIAGLACAGLAVSLGTASAQETQADGLQEVTVTARYISESLQRTPVSISAVTSAELEARGANDIAGLARSAPNVTLAEGPGGFGKSAVAMIRGVGQFDALPAF